MTNSQEAGPMPTLTIHDPADGSLVGELAVADAHEVDTAVQWAAKALPDWERTSPADRAGMVRAAATRVEEAAEQLSVLTTREMGKPLGDARGGVEAGVATLRQYAELGPLHRGASLQGGWSATDLMVQGPRGVVAAITPWNDPVAVPCGLLGAALVTGNTVVFKPSERTPHTGLELARLLAAELPTGVLDVVIGDGDTGATLAEHPGIDLIAHVGSTVTGRSLAATAARTGAKVLLENGGNDPLLVDEGVDIEWAAEQAAAGSFANAGQICTSIERIYVVEAVAERFLAALTRRAEALVVGPGSELLRSRSGSAPARARRD